MTWKIIIICVLSFIKICRTDIHADDYVIHSKKFPDDVRFRPPIGNGHIATNVLSDTVYMNGLFNGYEDRSSRARIPAYVSVDVADNDVINRSYSLDMYNGLFQQNIIMSGCNITITYIAHRVYTRVMAALVLMERNSNSSEKITVKLTNNTENGSSDFFTVIHDRFANGTGYYFGRTKEPELNETEPSSLHMYYTSLPVDVSLPSNSSSQLHVFVASHSINKTDAFDNFNLAINEKESLLRTHQDAWQALWREGRVDIAGNKELSQNVIAATYNILCSLPSKDDTIAPFSGLSPGGLSRGGLLVPNMPGGGHNDYAGHVFWDMETWMMPPIMLFHPEMGRRMIGSRSRVLEQAKKNALEAGYNGAKFPWEQATTGIEATPKWAGQMSRFEIHINADISYSIRQYMYANDDVTMVMSQRGFELALELARFWQSRSNRTAPQMVEILGVMGPDEYHYNIDNSVYTNYNAKLSLQLPRYIVNKFNIYVNNSIQSEINEFEKTADDILILFDEELQYHPQYEGFNLSNQIKQSDVVLLGYPLMMPMSRDIRLNDLELYENITNPEGPDTGTWSMHTVGWLELGNHDRAYKSFKMMLRNINEPFKVFSEKPVTNTSTGGCVNFITAAGGLLQSIVFGYGGIRLEPNRLVIHPSPILNTTEYSLVGIHYRSAIMNVHYNGTNDIVTLDVRKKDNVRVNLELETDSPGEIISINGKEAFTYKNQRAFIQVEKKKSSSKAPPTSAAGKSAAYKLLTLLIAFILTAPVNLKIYN